MRSAIGETLQTGRRLRFLIIQPPAQSVVNAADALRARDCRFWMIRSSPFAETSSTAYENMRPACHLAQGDPQDFNLHNVLFGRCARAQDNRIIDFATSSRPLVSEVRRSAYQI